MEAVQIRYPLFELPGSLQITGASFSGKSTILFSILKNRKALFTKYPETVIYCYVHHPGKALDGVENLVMHYGLPDIETLEGWVDSYSEKPWILALDDMSSDFYSSEISRMLMTRLVHHASVYLIVVGHRIFSGDRHARLASLNFHGFIFTRNVRDVESYGHFARQVLGAGYSKKFVNCYLDATQLKPGRIGYLYVSLHPLYSSRNFMLWTNVLPEESPLILYRL